jgi:hypothetical protein
MADGKTIGKWDGEVPVVVVIRRRSTLFVVW